MQLNRLGVWFFTDNPDALGAKREQDPIGNLQAHASYDFGPGLWLSVDGNFFTGGGTTVDGERGSEAQRSSRVGLSLSVPLRRGHSSARRGSRRYVRRPSTCRA